MAYPSVCIEGFQFNEVAALQLTSFVERVERMGRVQRMEVADSLAGKALPGQAPREHQASFKAE